MRKTGRGNVNSFSAASLLVSNGPVVNHGRAVYILMHVYVCRHEDLNDFVHVLSWCFSVGTWFVVMSACKVRNLTRFK